MAAPSLQTWLLAARPKTLPAAIAPVLMGSALAYADSGWHAPSALVALLAAVCIQIGTNLANDYADFQRGSDTEDRLGPTRVTQAGLMAPGTVKRATVFVFGLAFVLGIYLVFRGGWPIVIIGLASILFGYLYTAGPFPLAYNGTADLFVLLFFGPVAVGGTYYVQTLTITSPVIIAGLSPGLFSVAILTINNLRDIDSDRRANKKTLAVRFGAGYARTQYLLCLVLASALPAYLYAEYALPIYVVGAACVLLLATPLLRIVYTQEGRILNKVLAGTGRLLLIFAVLFSLGVVIA